MRVQLANPIQATFAATLAAACMLQGCADTQPPPEPLPTPVAVIPLRITDPSVSERIPGVAQPWAEEDLAFELPGQVTFVVENGTELQGRWIEDGVVNAPGQIVARLETEQYDAALVTAQADLAQAHVELQQVAPANIAVAEAKLDQARFNYQRMLEASERGAASPSELKAAQANLDVADAEVQSAKAGLLAAQATVTRQTAALARARNDLDRTTLWAPFSGRISHKHISAGGYAAPGTPVVTLTMMDPIEIHMQVAAQVSRNIQENDPVKVYLKGSDEPFPGSIYTKSTSADPQTRTFNVTAILRNRRVSDPQRADGAVPIEGLAVVMQDDVRNPTGVFVEERKALHYDGDDAYVFAIQGMQAQKSEVPDELILRRVPVSVGQRRINFQGLYIARELTDAGGLEPGDGIAMGAPSDASDGDKAFIATSQWTVRPGDLVSVDLGQASAEPGYYVPPDAIVTMPDGRAAIFLVGDDRIARRVGVTTGVNIAGMQRIESERLDRADNASVVIVGASLIRDGQRVTVLSERSP